MRHAVQEIRHQNMHIHPVKLQHRGIIGIVAIYSNLPWWSPIQVLTKVGMP